MPIQFRCPACDRRLSVGTRKAGTDTTCPGCGDPITVPGVGAISEHWEPEPLPNRPRRIPVAAVAIVTVLALFAVGAVVFAIGRASRAEPEQARVEPMVTAPQPAPPTVPQPAVAPSPQRPTPTPQDNIPQIIIPQITVPQQPPVVVPQVPQQVIPQPTQPQQPVVPVKEPPRLDAFGNPVGEEVGLGRPGEFKDKKLLFWSGFEGAGRVFFAPTNPLWKALERQGFIVRRAFGRFNPDWLKDTDQLWILSTGRFELPPGITPDLLAFAVTQLPPEVVPSGFTLPEYQFVVRATLDVMFSPMYPLDDKSYTAIVNFVKAGKGLCLLSDDEPFTVESNELARRLFGVGVGGNYLADKVAVVRGRKLSPVEVRKFGGQYEVDDHPLLTGVNFLFEGITVSHVGASDKLEVALKASDGQAIVAVSRVPNQRVVIDCGFTRYCHGPTERTSYIQKTAGTVRLGQNIAAFLAK